MAGALLWIAVSLVVIARQPAHAGSAIATVELVLSFAVIIIGCMLLRC